MIIEAKAEIEFYSHSNVPVIFMLRPRSGQGQWVMREECLCTPHLLMTEFTNAFGNLCQRTLISPGSFTLKSSCTVDTADKIDINEAAEFTPVENLPDSLFQFLLPSRYCQSDQLGDLARSVAGMTTPGYKQVAEIRDWIRNNIEYQYGTSNTSTSAADVTETRQGVCRDFAHLGMSLCRALNIPARMVVGFLHELKPMDLHAWFEAYVENRWYTFDATQEKPKGNRIALAYGRDAADVAMVTQFGPLDLQRMSVTVRPHRSNDLTHGIR